MRWRAHERGSLFRWRAASARRAGRTEGPGRARSDHASDASICGGRGAGSVRFADNRWRFVLGSHDAVRALHASAWRSAAMQQRSIEHAVFLRAPQLDVPAPLQQLREQALYRSRSRPVSLSLVGAPLTRDLTGLDL